MHLREHGRSSSLLDATIEVPGDIASEGVGLGVGGDVGKGAFAVDDLWMGWGEPEPNTELPAEIATVACGERKKSPSHLVNRKRPPRKLEGRNRIVNP